MNKQETLKDLRGYIIETYLLGELLPIEVYERFVYVIDLGLFNNNRGTFQKLFSVK